MNRGARHGGHIYVGTLDGRLVALDANTGKPAWSVQTTPQDKPCTITRAPRIVKGKVLIGNHATHHSRRQFDAIVLGGIYWQKGMVGFGDKITKTEGDAIHQYLIKRSHDLVDGKE